MPAIRRLSETFEFGFVRILIQQGDALADDGRFVGQRRLPDVSKARDVLGFEATTSLDQMLDVVIPWVTQAVRDSRL